MGNRTNKILIGVIILLIGIISLIQNRIGLNLGSITIAVAGTAFLLLYKTKKKIWSLLLGLYMSAIGVIGLLSPFIPSYISSRLIAAMLFAVPGIIFIVLFRQNNRAPLLFPGSLLIWVGIYIVLAGLPFLRENASGLFFVCIGLGFFTVYKLGKDYFGKFSMYFGIFMCFIGLILMGGLFPSLGLIKRMSSIGSVILIGVSIYIIINAIRKE